MFQQTPKSVIGWKSCEILKGGSYEMAAMMLQILIASWGCALLEPARNTPPMVCLSTLTHVCVIIQKGNKDIFTLHEQFNMMIHY